MQLTLWTYEGPPHVGAMRIATAMEGVHYVLHAPQGDTYADLLFTMIERRERAPAVTYTTFQARDLGGDTADCSRTCVGEAYERFKPQAMLVGASCTAELIQDQPGGLAQGLGLPIPVVPLELPAYSKKENWGAGETFYQLVRAMAGPSVPAPGTPRAERPRAGGRAATCSGPRCWAFAIVTTSRRSRGCSIGWVWTSTWWRPLGATPADSLACREADFNVMLYPEIAIPLHAGSAEVRQADGQDRAARRRRHARVHRRGGGGGRRRCRRRRWEPRFLAPDLVLAVGRFHVPHRQARVRFRRRHHVNAAARIAHEELGFDRGRARHLQPRAASDVREVAEAVRDRGLISDDYLEVEAGRRAAARAGPRHADGAAHRQAARHRLRGDLGADACAGRPGALLAADGLRGRQRVFDTWVHPLMMGLEEHLLEMFRGDFEFHDEGGTLRTGRCPGARGRAGPAPESLPTARAASSAWAPEAEKELSKIPFFVRGRRAATPSASLRSGIWRSSWSRPCTMPKRISAADGASNGAAAVSRRYRSAS